MKNVFTVKLAIAFCAVVLFGVFATTVQAETWGEYGGYEDWGSYGGYEDGGSYGGYEDWGSYGGYEDWGSYGGYEDWGSYGGYENEFYPSTNDFEPYANDFEPYVNDFEPYTNDFEPYANDFEPYASSNEYYNEYVDEYYYSTDSYSTAQYHQTPMTIAPPRYTPPIYQAPPVYTPPRQQPPRQQPPVVIPPAPSVTNTNINTNTNTCVTNSCNTNIDNSIVDNSINGSFNTNTVATVVPVTPQPVIQYTYPQPVPQQNLYCVISASQTSIAAGQTTYLAWSSSYNVTSATLSEFGSVAPSGTRAVYPSSTRTYVLTVYGSGTGYGYGSNSATCSVTVNVNNPAPYVSLSQIPYTGLDLGLFGSALYWMSLLSFAVAGGYLMVYYRGGALSVAMETVRAFRSSNVHASETPEPVSETLVAAPAAPAPEETSYNALASLPVMASRSTRDSMQVTRDESGTPRIVIARA
jgi:hypothetical protein